jgi:hypothetical protein
MRMTQHPVFVIPATLALLLITAASGCKSSTSASNAASPNPASPAAADSSAAANAPSGSAANAASAAPASVPERPKPVRVTLTVEPGKDINVRITETINSKTASVGDPFSGVLTSALVTRSGEIVLPKGARVSGSVVSARGEGRFKGAGVLAIELREVGGHPVAATEYVVSRKGKGKRSAALIGGGAGAGALIGGLAGGGKGALLGGLIGGGAGPAGAGLTGNKPLIIPTESIVVFELSQPLSITVER